MTCILGKGVKEDESSNVLDMKEYFKTKQKSKKIQIDKHNRINNEDAIVTVEEVNEQITDNMKDMVETKSGEHEFNTIPPKKKKRELQLAKESESLPPATIKECDNDVESKKKLSQKVPAYEEKNDVDQSKKKNLKSNIIKDTDVKESNSSEKNDECSNINEQASKLVLTRKYENLMNLLIENSSAGKKYYKDSTSNLLFEEKIKEFVDNVKHQYATTVDAAQTEFTEKELTSNKPIVLNPVDPNFVKNFEAQKFKTLEFQSKRQEVLKYLNEKAMFIAKHGNVLFFGSNINDIKGYGDW